MGRFKYLECQGCKRPRSEVKLNRKGYCHECAWKRCWDAVSQMHEKRGEYYQKWYLGMVAYAEHLKQEER